jgi:hypothetical protein
MRRLILAAAFVALTPLAYAQSNAPGSMDTPGSSTAGVVTAQASAVPPSSGPASGQPDPGNCGTPDEPKSCGPMPRHALKHFHAKRTRDAG